MHDMFLPEAMINCGDGAGGVLSPASLDQPANRSSVAVAASAKN
jgi:hypothetical protein